jgi:coenzyme F420-reducing hydrogenase delta subunit
MYNLSSAEGPRFARIAAEMVEKISGLGPNPIKKAKETAA